MIIRLEVQEINYEECFRNLIPHIIEKCDSRTDLTEIEKLLVRLGTEAVPVMEKLLRYLDTDSRDQMFVWLLEEHQDTFISTANTEMRKALSGDAVMLGGLYAKDQPGPKITLYATQVQIDYKKLADSPVLGGFVGGAAKLAFQLSKPEKLEKRGMSLLSSELVRPMFISVLSDSLEKAGLILSLGDVELLDDYGVELPLPMKDPTKDEGLIPDLIEDQILDAIAAWLKDSL